MKVYTLMYTYSYFHPPVLRGVFLQKKQAEDLLNDELKYNQGHDATCYEIHELTLDEEALYENS